jgi:hypothetical protein
MFLIQAKALSIDKTKIPTVAAGVVGKLESASQLFNSPIALPEFFDARKSSIR